jgi:hypothetical protein
VVSAGGAARQSTGYQNIRNASAICIDTASAAESGRLGTDRPASAPAFWWDCRVHPVK